MTDVETSLSLKEDDMQICIQNFTKKEDESPDDKTEIDLSITNDNDGNPLDEKALDQPQNGNTNHNSDSPIKESISNDLSEEVPASLELVNENVEETVAKDASDEKPVVKDAYNEIPVVKESTDEKPLDDLTENILSEDLKSNSDEVVAVKLETPVLDTESDVKISDELTENNLPTLTEKDPIEEGLYYLIFIYITKLIYKFVKLIN